MAVQVNRSYLLGEYRLELDQRMLTHAGAPVRLTGKPFHVLVYLVENRHRIISRAELLDRFWEGSDVYDVSLSKCIGAIRKALDDRKQTPRFIETRWAEGYRYIGPFEGEISESGPRVVEIERTRVQKLVVEEDDSEAPPAPETVVPVELPARGMTLAPPKLSLRTAVLVIAFAAILLAAAAIMFTRSRSIPGEGTPSPIRSIAILPLKNLTGDPNKDYLCDGLSDSLIGILSKLKDLKVISRSSAFTFKNKETDPREVGKTLGVEGLLEGSLKLNADKLHVEVRLVSAADGRVLWASDGIERETKNAFEIQDGVACVVGAELKVRLCGEGELSQSKTKNNEAYEAYLKGRHLWHTRNPDNMKQAIELFSRAVKLDPDYALAYAGLADTYAVMEVNAQLSPGAGAPKAKEYAQKALALDDSLAGPYAALGLVASVLEWRWAESEHYFQRALERNPGYATAHHWFGFSLFARGHFAEAEAELKRAAELDPLAYGISNTLVMMYYYGGMYEECLTQAEVNLKLIPDDINAPYYKALVFLRTGRPDKAVESFQGAFTENREIGSLWAQGRTDEARLSLDKWAKPGAKRTIAFNNNYIATWYAYLGDKESALAWLEKSFDKYEAMMAFIKVHPAFATLHDDPRFADLVRRIGLAGPLKE